MSNGTDLRVSRSVALLGEMQAAIASFAKREEALVRDIAARRTAVNRKQREGLERVESARERDLAAIEAAYQGEEERIRALYAGRRARIDRGYASSIKAVAKRARGEKEKFIGELQMRHLKAERNLPRDLKAADQEAAEFRAALAEQQAALVHAEATAWKYFSGYDALQKRLRRGASSRPDETGADEQGQEARDSANASDEAAARSHHDLAAELQTRLDALGMQLAAFRSMPLPRLFSIVPVSICALVILIAAVVLAFALSFSGKVSLGGAAGIGAVIAAILGGAVFAIHRTGQGQAQPGCAADRQ